MSVVTAPTREEARLREAGERLAHATAALDAAHDVITVAAREDLEGTGVLLDDDHVHAAIYSNLDVLRSRAAASDASLGAEAGSESEEEGA